MIKHNFLPICKSYSFIKSCGKPTITSTTMQECHDDDKIEPNEYTLLYKEAEILMSSLGRFLECQKCNIKLLVINNMGTHALPDIRTRPQALRTLGLTYIYIYIYQEKHSCPCYKYSVPYTSCHSNMVCWSHFSYPITWKTSEIHACYMHTSIFPVG